jgi:DNA-binding GntR family transcriptional regulator
MLAESGNGAQAAGGLDRLPAPAGRGLMKDRAYDEIKRYILCNDFAPGTFLAERQLAAQLGMSKTPVKSALERLEHEGFITVSPQQGIVVRSLTVEEVADQYEIRVALEGYTVRAIAGRLTPEQVARLRANLRAQEAVCATGAVADAVTLDMAFHLLFPECLGNQEVLRVMQQLREKMGRVIGKVFQLHRDRINSSYEEHSAIADAVIRGHRDRAARLMEAHLKRGKEMILAPRR